MHGLLQGPQVPDNELPVEPGSADFVNFALAAGVDAETSDSVLMDRVQISIGDLGLLLVQRLELAHGRQASRLLLLRHVQLGDKLHLVFAERVQNRDAAMPRRYDAIISNPHAVHERQVLRWQFKNRISAGSVGHVNSRIVSDPADFVPVGGKASAVHPTAS